MSTTEKAIVYTIIFVVMFVGINVVSFIFSDRSLKEYFAERGVFIKATFAMTLLSTIFIWGLFILLPYIKK